MNIDAYFAVSELRPESFIPRLTPGPHLLRHCKDLGFETDYCFRD